MKLIKRFKKYWKKNYPNKWSKNIWTRGPLSFYRCTKTGSLDVTLKIFEDKPFGWEWGYKDPMRGPDKPLIEFRIGKLWILYLEMLQSNRFEVWFMGFWWIV